MTATVRKASFKILQPKNKHYRDYSRQENSVFTEHLLQSIDQTNLGNSYLYKSVKTCAGTLKKTPRKNNYVNYVMNNYGLFL